MRLRAGGTAAGDSESDSMICGGRSRSKSLVVSSDSALTVPVTVPGDAGDDSESVTATQAVPLCAGPGHRAGSGRDRAGEHHSAQCQ